jgi:hypothetical protein
MPIPLADTDLSSVSVGSTGSIDLTPIGVGAGGVSSNPAFTKQQASVFLANESGAGLRIAFDVSGQGLTLPAGAWGPLALPLGTSKVTWVVAYKISNPAVQTLFATYFAPGEPVTSFVLGNSPIGGVTQISNPNFTNAVIRQNQLLSVGSNTFTHNLGWTPTMIIAISTGVAACDVNWVMSTANTTTCNYWAEANCNATILFLQA